MRVYEVTEACRTEEGKVLQTGDTLTIFNDVHDSEWNVVAYEVKNEQKGFLFVMDKEKFESVTEALSK